ncbi:MAG: signal peptide peptidase SppA [Elusimicrobia bacterium]|nr:signal peptide peptidase SppA [Candidatus Obscuribacterium magneticum]
MKLKLSLKHLKSLKVIHYLIALHAAVILLTLIYIFRDKPPAPPVTDRIVIIPIEGTISMDEDSLGNGLSVTDIVNTLENLREKDEVKAVVLRINSPGGSVGAVQEIVRALHKFRAKRKFVISSFGDVAASGGYYIACAGDAIVSNPGTLTGSIGVIMQLPNVEGLLSKVGISFQTIKSGAMKDSGSPFRKMSIDEQKYFSQIILDAYGQFYQAVKEGRKMSDDKLKPLADGRVFIGRQAQELKLVDQLGGLEEAVELAKKRAGLEGKKPKIVTYEKKNPLERMLRLLNKEPLKQIAAQWGRSQIQLLYLMQ